MQMDGWYVHWTSAISIEPSPESTFHALSPLSVDFHGSLDKDGGPTSLTLERDLHAWTVDSLVTPNDCFAA